MEGLLNYLNSLEQIIICRGFFELVRKNIIRHEMKIMKVML